MARLANNGWLGALVATFLLGLTSATARATEYTFGVLSQRSAVLTAQHWNPILDYIQRRSGVSLALRVARTAPESNAATQAGEYDFVYSNTIFQPSMLGAGYRVILRPRAEGIRGQLVCLDESPVRRLKDLDGRNVGFPSQAAFVGYAVPMDHLLRQGLRVQAVFGGNQEGIIAQMRAGAVAAAGVNSQVMAAFAQREGLKYRVLWESPAYHNIPIAAHPRVPAPEATRVQRVLAAMADDEEGRRILEEVGKLLGQPPPYGFLAATSDDYGNYAAFYRDTLVTDIR